MSCLRPELIYLVDGNEEIGGKDQFNGTITDPLDGSVTCIPDTLCGVNTLVEKRTIPISLPPLGRGRAVVISLSLDWYRDDVRTIDGRNTRHFRLMQGDTEVATIGAKFNSADTMARVFGTALNHSITSDFDYPVRAIGTAQSYVRITLGIFQDTDTTGCMALYVNGTLIGSRGWSVVDPNFVLNPDNIVVGEAAGPVATNQEYYIRNGTVSVFQGAGLNRFSDYLEAVSAEPIGTTDPEPFAAWTANPPVKAVDPYPAGYEDGRPISAEMRALPPHLPSDTSPLLDWDFAPRRYLQAFVSLGGDPGKDLPVNFAGMDFDFADNFEVFTLPSGLLLDPGNEREVCLQLGQAVQRSDTELTCEQFRPRVDFERDGLRITYTNDSPLEVYRFVIQTEYQNLPLELNL